ncbi:MAG: hypothetical protein ACSHYA_03160 [Opitutaceae bacterium]
MKNAKIVKSQVLTLSVSLSCFVNSHAAINMVFIEDEATGSVRIEYSGSWEGNYDWDYQYGGYTGLRYYERDAGNEYAFYNIPGPDASSRDYLEDRVSLPVTGTIPWDSAGFSISSAASTGQSFGFHITSSGYVDYVYAPLSYESGDPISGSVTYTANLAYPRTLSQFGFTPDEIANGGSFSFGAETIYWSTQDGSGPPTNSDSDPGSDTWETANGFDPNVDGDVATLDSDGDGDLDIFEIFQGTDRNGSSESYGFQEVGVTSGEQELTTQFRRSTTQSAVAAVSQWSCDLVNWYDSGESADGITVSTTETVVSSGSGYEIVEAKTEVTSGSSDCIFYRLELVPVE